MAGRRRADAAWSWYRFDSPLFRCVFAFVRAVAWPGIDLTMLLHDRAAGRHHNGRQSHGQSRSCFMDETSAAAAAAVGASVGSGGRSAGRGRGAARKEQERALTTEP